MLRKFASFPSLDISGDLDMYWIKTCSFFHWHFVILVGPSETDATSWISPQPSARGNPATGLAEHRKASGWNALSPYGELKVWIW